MYAVSIRQGICFAYNMYDPVVRIFVRKYWGSMHHTSEPPYPLAPGGQYTPPARIWCATLHLTGADHIGDSYFFLTNHTLSVYFLRLRHLLIYILRLPSRVESWLYMSCVLIAHTFYVLQTQRSKLFVYVCWLLWIGVRQLSHRKGLHFRWQYQVSYADLPANRAGGAVGRAARVRRLPHKCHNLLKYVDLRSVF